MTILTAIALTLVLLSTPAGADDPPAPPAPPARPDFSVIQKHLVVVRDGLESEARQAPGIQHQQPGPYRDLWEGVARPLIVSGLNCRGPVFSHPH